MVYPDSVCRLSGIVSSCGVAMANFLITPFEFDTSNRILFFVDSITIDLELEAQSIRKSPPRMTLRSADYVKTMVINPDSVQFIEDLTTGDAERIEYLIITNEELKESFEPLAEWKRKKGVPSKILTIEEIDAEYESQTLLMRIKEAILDYADKYKTSYILLGGDISIIPTQMCFVYIKPYENGEAYGEDLIPADVYYSCYGELNWDTNNDGHAGALADKYNYSPNLAVTRALVRCASDVDAFVNRTLEYEQRPKCQRDFFLSGTILNAYVRGDRLAETLYDEVVVNKIPIGSVRLFDTYSNTGQSFSANSIRTELEKGYQFAQIFSHGEKDGFYYETGSAFF